MEKDCLNSVCRPIKNPSGKLQKTNQGLLKWNQELDLISFIGFWGRDVEASFAGHHSTHSLQVVSVQGW